MNEPEEENQKKKNTKMKLPVRLVIDFHEIFISKAWLSLTGIAPQVYMIFLLKRKMVKINKKKGKEKYRCVNTRELVFTYAEAKDPYGIAPTTFRRAIDDLISKGLIDVVTSVGGLFKEVTLYGLSDRWRNYDKPEFEENPRPKRNHTVGFCKPDYKKKQIKKEQNEQMP